MKTFIVVITLLLGASGSYAASVRQRSENQAIPGQYIIQLTPGSTFESVAAHQLRVRRLARRGETSFGNTFSIGEFNGYTGVFDDTAIAAIAELPEVVSVEPDYFINVPETGNGMERRDLITQSDAAWHLGDLSHNAAGSTEYVYDDIAGQGMTAYVVDTGMRLSHEEFEGRAIFGFSAPLNSTVQNGTNSDTDGHGTHVGGTIAGKTYGVAKKATVVDVKIFLDGVGTSSWGLAGLNWAVNDIISKSAQNSSVINLSLATTTTSRSWDNAVTAAYQLGIVAIAAAGNNDGPASEWTPARVPAAITVGMTDPSRNRVSITEGIYGSNYGPELDLFAPGRDIISADYQSDTGLATKTGTSMATPLVAGLICYLRTVKGGMGSPDEVLAKLVELSHKDVISNPKGSPNLLVYNGSGQ